MNDETQAAGALGSVEGLGLAPERAAFAVWMRGRSDHYEYQRGIDRLLKFGAAGLPEVMGLYHDPEVQTAWEAWQAAGSIAHEAARADLLDCPAEEQMALDRAEGLARAWAAGSLIGGDAHQACVVLLRELDRLRPNAELRGHARTKGREMSDTLQAVKAPLEAPLEAPVRSLVERLRAQSRAIKWTRGLDTDYATTWEPDPLCQEAADTIERLREHAVILAETAREVERERIKATLLSMDSAVNRRHNYFAYAAVALFGPGTAVISALPTGPCWPTTEIE